MRQGMGHMLNRELSRGWRGWGEMISARAAYIGLLRRGMSFMVNRELAQGFRRWSSSVGASSAMSRGLKHMLNI